MLPTISSRHVQSRHSITPFKLTFNVLQHQSEEFGEIADANPALYISLKDQFIPAMEYTYTYDNASARGIKIRFGGNRL